MRMNQQPIWAIVGTGMGGKGLAAQLGLDGHRVRVHDKVEAQVAGIRERGGLRVEGRPKEFAPVELATTDLQAAVDGAEVIIICTYGGDDQPGATPLPPLLRGGPLILLVQGPAGGALGVWQAPAPAGWQGQDDGAEMGGD